jgi:hypothetical protein
VRLSAAGIVILAALLPPAPAPAQDPDQPGGNKALMQDWVRKKQQARDQVYRELKRQNLLPKDGSVSFEATVKPDPKARDKYQVRIESMSISETPQGQTKRNDQADPVFGPRSPEGSGPQAKSTPPADRRVRDRITIMDGRPLDGTGAAAQ